MKEDEQFDFGQLSDFMGVAMPFGEDLFEEKTAVDLEDGIIDRPFLPLRDLVLFPQTLITILYLFIFLGTMELSALYFILFKLIVWDNIFEPYL